MPVTGEITELLRFALHEIPVSEKDKIYLYKVFNG